MCLHHIYSRVVPAFLIVWEMVSYFPPLYSIMPRTFLLTITQSALSFPSHISTVVSVLLFPYHGIPHTASYVFTFNPLS